MKTKNEMKAIDFLKNGYDSESVLLGVVIDNGLDISEIRKKKKELTPSLLIVACLENHNVYPLLNGTEEILKTEEFEKFYSFSQKFSPLLKKLKGEMEKSETKINKEKKEALKNMRTGIMQAIYFYTKDNGTDEFVKNVNTSISKGKPFLDQQDGLKKMIDDLVSKIYNILPNFLKTRDKDNNVSNRYSLFASPNPVKEEIEQVTKEMEGFSKR